jgi:hypothetical protein
MKLWSYEILDKPPPHWWGMWEDMADSTILQERRCVKCGIVETRSKSSDVKDYSCFLTIGPKEQEK